MNKSRVLLHLSLMLLTVPFVNAEEAEEAIEQGDVAPPVLRQPINASAPKSVQTQDWIFVLNEKALKADVKVQRDFLQLLSLLPEEARTHDMCLHAAKFLDLTVRDYARERIINSFRKLPLEERSDMANLIFSPLLFSLLGQQTLDGLSDFNLWAQLDICEILSEGDTKTYAKSIFQAMADVDGRERKRVAEIATKFFTPKMSKSERLAIIKAVGGLAPEDRQDILNKASSSWNPKMNGLRLVNRIRVLSLIPKSERTEEACQKLLNLFSDEMQWYEEDTIIDEINAIEEKDRLSVIFCAAQLFTPKADESDKGALIKSISKVSVKERKEIVRLVSSFLALDIEPFFIAMFIDCLAEVKASERAEIASNIKSLLTPDMSSLEKTVVVGYMSFTPKDSHCLKTYHHLQKMYLAGKSDEQRTYMLALLMSIPRQHLTLEMHQQISGLYRLGLGEETLGSLAGKIKELKDEKKARVLRDFFALLEFPGIRSCDLDEVTGLAEELDDIKESKRADAIRDAAPLFATQSEKKWSPWEVGEVLEVISEIDAGQRADVIRKAMAYFTPKMEGNEKCDLIRLLSVLPKESRTSENCAEMAAILFPEMERDDKINMIHYLAHMSQGGALDVVRKSKRLFAPGFTNFYYWTVVRTVGSVSKNEREEFVDRIVSLMPAEMPGWKRMELMELMVLLPREFRMSKGCKQLVEIIFQGRTRCVCSLENIPIEKRVEVARLLISLLKPGTDGDVKTALTRLFSVLPSKFLTSEVGKYALDIFTKDKDDSYCHNLISILEGVDENDREDALLKLGALSQENGKEIMENLRYSFKKMPESCWQKSVDLLHAKHQESQQDFAKVVMSKGSVISFLIQQDKDIRSKAYAHWQDKLGEYGAADLATLIVENMKGFLLDLKHPLTQTATLITGPMGDIAFADILGTLKTK